MLSLDQVVYELSEELKSFPSGPAMPLPDKSLIWFWVKHWFDRHLEIQTDKILLAMDRDKRRKAEQEREEWEHLAPYVDNFLLQHR